MNLIILIPIAFAMHYLIFETRSIDFFLTQQDQLMNNTKPPYILTTLYNQSLLQQTLVQMFICVSKEFCKHDCLCSYSKE
ncbi:hypothetical protein QL285_020061 [Trifolium repens]|nr:hypothetical protein QL285_020061 [Trifolium repens]